MFFWFIGPSILAVFEVFRSRGLDYRLIGVGALLPLVIDAPLGRFGPGHSLVVAVAALTLVMVTTIGRSRMLRRRLVCVPIGWFCGLLLSGAFLHDQTFLWPLLGTETGHVGLFPPPTLLVLGEAAGLAVIGWSVGRFGLDQAATRAEFARSGRLEEAR
ncbi:MAG: hypothetical protein JJE46_07070 [Acidimicrobiia bacterium]|nr:hypothetical protein [Acidimicrobiia bacterium]